MFPEDDVERISWEPLDYFVNFMPDEIFQLLMESTNVCYMQKLNKSMNLSVDELKVFFGVTVMISICGYPEIDMYWQKEYEVPIISSAMKRPRYYLIRKYLRVVNSNDPGVSEHSKAEDKLWKVRPMLNLIKGQCLKLSRPNRVCIDEQMIPYEGKFNPVRQFVPSKPNPTGIKNFVLATPDGLALDFEVFRGANTFKDRPEIIKSMGLGACAVHRLSETLPTDCIIFTDKYFNGEKIFTHMLKQGIRMTGPLKLNLLPRYLKTNKVLKSDSEMKKGSRGDFDAAVNSNNSIMIVKWFDNKPINMMSTIHSGIPTDKVVRWNKKDKIHIEISRPNVVAQYNENMGGVDLLDRIISYYPSRARTNVWIIRLIFHFLDFAIANAWILYRKDMRAGSVRKANILKSREFKENIGKCMLRRAQTSSRRMSRGELEVDELNVEDQENIQPFGAKRRRVQPLLPLSVIQTGARHLPEFSDQASASRCRLRGCSGKTNIQCIECKVFLCCNRKQNCFRDYHL